MCLILIKFNVTPLSFYCGPSIIESKAEIHLMPLKFKYQYCNIYFFLWFKLLNNYEWILHLFVYFLICLLKDKNIKKLKRELEGWREIILHANSVLLWEKNWHPGLIAGISTVFFLYVDLWWRFFNSLIL